MIQEPDRRLRPHQVRMEDVHRMALDAVEAVKRTVVLSESDEERLYERIDDLIEAFYDAPDYRNHN